MGCQGTQRGGAELSTADLAVAAEGADAALAADDLTAPAAAGDLARPATGADLAPPPADLSIVGLATMPLYVDPRSVPATWVQQHATDPSAARIGTAIASRPIAKWFGAFSGDIAAAVDDYVGRAAAAGQLPMLVAYNIPGRDACGGQSSGGAATPEAYRAWIASFAQAIGTRPALVLIEPDSLADFSCMTAAQITTRNELITYAGAQLKSGAPNAWAYLDAGNAMWVAAPAMADRLDAAGLASVHGFVLNISNFFTTAQSATYADAVNTRLRTHGYSRPFVIDTSRNGNGSNGEWCNPAGRKLGQPPQAGAGGAELLLWIKTPGASDGQCGIAPTVAAGTFTADLANHLIDGQ
jgi:endoglucanase